MTAHIHPSYLKGVKAFDTTLCLWQLATIRCKSTLNKRDMTMPKEEWGTKRLCPETGKRFYDLNADPIISPYTGNEVAVDTGKTRTMVADAEDAQSKKMQEASEDEELVLDDDVDDDDVDADLGDDVLDDDDDDDTVSLDELADVPTNDDE